MPLFLSLIAVYALDAVYHGPLHLQSVYFSPSFSFLLQLLPLTQVLYPTTQISTMSYSYRTFSAYRSNIRVSAYLRDSKNAIPHHAPYPPPGRGTCPSAALSGAAEVAGM